MIGASFTAIMVTLIVSVFSAPIGSVAVNVIWVEPDHSSGADMFTM